MVIAAHLAEDIHCVALARLVLSQAIDNYLPFNTHAFIVNAAAAAHRKLGVQTQEGAGDSGGGSGVTNAHLAGIEQIVALVDAHIRHVHAHLERGFRLLLGHGRALGEVFRTPGYLSLVNVVDIA